MPDLRRLLGRRVASDTTVIRLVQIASFAAAPAVMAAALRGAVRLAATPGEVFLGVLAGSALALLLTVLGLVLPLALSEADAKP